MAQRPERTISSIANSIRARKSAKQLARAVDLALDFVELGLLAADTDAPAESIKRVQRLLPGDRRSGTQELPGRGQDRSKAARDHRRQEDDVAPFVEEAFLRAIV